MLKEFKDFIMRGNVVDLAVGIIMGAAFGKIVTSLVNDIIMPPIGQLLGGIDFKSLFFALNRESYVSLEKAKEAGAAVIAYGSFVQAIIDFTIIGFCVFLIVKSVNKLQKRVEKPKSLPADTVLLTEIRDLLKK